MGVSDFICNIDLYTISNLCILVLYLGGRMKKIKILAMSLLLLILTIYLPAFATEESYNSNEMIEGFDPLIDDAELFSDVEEEELFQRIKHIREEYDFDVTILTMNKIPDDSRNLREYFDWYEQLDPKRDGVVVGVNMEEGKREFTISTRNLGMKAFTDDALDLTNKVIPPMLTNAHYMSAFKLYLEYTEEFVGAARARQLRNIWIFVVIIPILLAGVSSWYVVKRFFVAKMQTAVEKTEAKDFIKRGSLRLSEKEDNYTYTSENAIFLPSAKTIIGGVVTAGNGGNRGGSSTSF